MKKFFLNNMVQGILHYILGTYLLVTFVAGMMVELPTHVIVGMVASCLFLIGYNVWVSDELNKSL